MNSQSVMQVIPGLDEGVVGMRAGGRRRFIVSSGLAYGSVGIPGHVPPDSLLHLEVREHTAEDKTCFVCV